MCLTPSLRAWSTLRNTYYYSTPPDLSTVFFVVKASSFDKNMVIYKLQKEFTLKTQRKPDNYNNQYSSESASFTVEFIGETFYKIVIDARKLCFTLDFIFPIRDCQESTRTQVKLNSFQAQRNILKHIKETEHYLRIRRDSRTGAVILENMKVFNIMKQFSCENQLRDFDMKLTVTEVLADRTFSDHFQNQIRKIDQLPTVTEVSWPNECNINPPSLG